MPLAVFPILFSLACAFVSSSSGPIPFCFMSKSHCFLLPTVASDNGGCICWLKSVSEAVILEDWFWSDGSKIPDFRRSLICENIAAV